jgi:hypothetical protein
VMLWAPRFGVPGHIGAAGWVTEVYIPRIGAEISAGEVIRQDGIDGKVVGMDKLRSYKFTNKWLV